MPIRPCPPLGRAASPPRDGFATVSSTASRAEGELDVRAAAAVTGRVGQRLLEDPVRGLVDGAGQRPRRAARSSVTARPAAVVGDKRPQRGEAGRRRLGGRRLAQACSDLVDLADRLARELLDRLQRLRGRSGRVARSRAAPARTAITLIAWPAESCRSRAIRARSSATASRRSRSASRSARCARSSSSAMCPAQPGALAREPADGEREPAVEELAGRERGLARARGDPDPEQPEDPERRARVHGRLSRRGQQVQRDRRAERESGTVAEGSDQPSAIASSRRPRAGSAARPPAAATSRARVDAERVEAPEHRARAHRQAALRVHPRVPLTAAATHDVEADAAVSEQVRTSRPSLPPPRRHPPPQGDPVSRNVQAEVPPGRRFPGGPPAITSGRVSHLLITAAVLAVVGLAYLALRRR